MPEYTAAAAAIIQAKYKGDDIGVQEERKVVWKVAGLLAGKTGELLLLLRMIKMKITVWS